MCRRKRHSAPRDSLFRLGEIQRFYGVNAGRCHTGDGFHVDQNEREHSPGMKTMSHRIAILVVCVALGLLGWRGMFSLPSDDSTASVIVSGGSSASASDLAALIDNSRSAATLRNEAGLTLCTSKITGILDREFSDLYRGELNGHV